MIVLVPLKKTTDSFPRDSNSRPTGSDRLTVAQLSLSDRQRRIKIILRWVSPEKPMPCVSGTCMECIFPCVSASQAAEVSVNVCDS